MPSRTAHVRTWVVALAALAAYIVPTQAADQAGYAAPVALNISVVADGVTLAPLSSKLDADVLLTHVVSTDEGAMFAFSRIRAGSAVADPPVLLTPRTKLARASRPLPVLIDGTRYVAIPTSDGLFLVDPAAPGAAPAVLPELHMIDVLVDDVNLDGHDDLVGIGASGGKKGKSVKKAKEPSDPGLPPGNATPGTPAPGNLSPYGVQVWLGDGSSFVPSQSIGATADYFTGVDVDADGDTDLVIFDNGGYSVRENAGGVFTARGPFVLIDAPVDTPPLAVYANNDSIVDLAFGSGGAVLVMMGSQDGFEPPQTLFTIPAPSGQSALVTSVELLTGFGGGKKGKKIPPTLAVTSYADYDLQPVMLSTKTAAGSAFGAPVPVSPALTTMDLHWASGYVDANQDGLHDLVVLANGNLAFMHGLPSLDDYHALQAELTYMNDAYAGLQQQHAAELAKMDAIIRKHEQKSAQLEARIEVLTANVTALESSNATLALAVDRLNAELTDALTDLTSTKVALKSAQMELARVGKERDALLLRILGEPHSAIVAEMAQAHARQAFDDVSETVSDPRLKQAARHLALAERALADAQYREAIRESRRAYQVVQKVIEDPRPPKPKPTPKPKPGDAKPDKKDPKVTDTKDK
jgi:hypothetical protein